MASNPLGIRRIDHVAWTVPELGPVIDFYQRVFGAELLYRLGPIDARDIPRAADGRDWTEAHVAVADARLHLALLRLPGDAKLELFSYERPSSVTAAPLRSNHVGSSHLGLEVDDIDDAAQRLRDAGCTAMERIAFDEGPTAGSQFQYFLDPWQNIVELVVHGRPVRGAAADSGAAGANRHRHPVNPETMYASVPFGFSHAVLQTGGRTLHLAGQVAWDSQCQVVGAGDLAAQTRQALANLRQVLACAGATPADVVRLRTYVVNHSPDKLGPDCAEIAAFYGDAAPAANTFIGVQALALPDFLIEIEADAVLRE